MHLITTFSILLCVSTLAMGGGMFDNIGSGMKEAMGKMANGAGGNPMEMAQEMMRMAQENDVSKIQSQFKAMMKAAQKMPQAAGEESQKIIAEAKKKFDGMVENGEASPEAAQSIIQEFRKQMESMQG